jgi:hypothetical protein
MAGALFQRFGREFKRGEAPLREGGLGMKERSGD